MTSVSERFRLDGRLALITGSSAGIGLAIARGLAQAGARVVLNGRTAETLHASAETLRSEGLEVHSRVFDVTDSDAIRHAVADIEMHLGPIETLVNNAGMQRRGPLEEFSESHWSELMRTNLDSAFLVGQAVARYMIISDAVKAFELAADKSQAMKVLPDFGVADINHR
jgi:gluconate 5-dehydrogenase